MKRTLITLSLVLSIILPTELCGRNVKFLVGGSGWNKIAIVDKQSKEIEWEHELEAGWECNSVAMTREGNILFAYKKGARLITMDHKVLWDIKAPENSELHTARIMEDGNILLACAGFPVTIMEVDMSGKVLSKTEYDLQNVLRAHGQFRQINKRDNGNYLIPVVSRGELLEIDREGKLVRTTNVKARPFTAEFTAKGDCWIGGGDAHSLLLVDPDNGEVLKEYRKEIDGVELYYVSGMSLARKGHIYLTNWQGHDKTAKEKNDPQIIEIDKKGNVVWSLADQDRFGKISTIDIID